MKKKRKWLFLALGIFVVVIAAVIGIRIVSSQINRKEYTEQIEQAEKYLAEQDFENAILCYEAAIDANPDDESAYLGIAETYMEMSRPSQARYYLNLGMKRVSNSGQLQFMLNKVLDGTWESKYRKSEEVTEEEKETEEEEEIQTVKVKGTIVDAVTGSGVPDATVTAVLTQKPEESQVEDNFQASADTKASGQYELELPAGTYRVEVLSEGYIEEQFEMTVADQNITNQNFTISPELEEGEIRIVLEWGAQPTDLDAYLFKNKFNIGDPVFFGDKGSESFGAMLDVDDRNGFGPETITIYDVGQTWYYGVHDYTESENGLAASGATVKVYLPGEEPRTYTVPSGDGDCWSVCKIAGGQIQEINKIGNMFSE